MQAFQAIRAVATPRRAKQSRLEAAPTIAISLNVASSASPLFPSSRGSLADDRKRRPQCRVGVQRAPLSFM
jgi:hypothetical protein